MSTPAARPVLGEERPSALAGIAAAVGSVVLASRDRPAAARRRAGRVARRPVPAGRPRGGLVVGPVAGAADRAARRRRLQLVPDRPHRPLHGRGHPRLVRAGDLRPRGGGREHPRRARPLAPARRGAAPPGGRARLGGRRRPARRGLAGRPARADRTADRRRRRRRQRRDRRGRARRAGGRGGDRAARHPRARRHAAACPRRSRRACSGACASASRPRSGRCWRAALERDRLAAEVVETEALRRSDALKTALLRATSHDLRSPITAIIAAGETLRSPTLPHADREELADVVVGEGRGWTS